MRTRKDEDPESLDDDVLVLEDEDGKESRFRVLFDSLFVEDKHYVILMPQEEEDFAEPEIVILRVEEVEGGTGVLVTIDSDNEWEQVLKAFEELELEDDLDDCEIVVEGDWEEEPEG